jgi:hypothetical protein
MIEELLKRVFEEDKYINYIFFEDLIDDILELVDVNKTTARRFVNYVVYKYPKTRIVAYDWYMGYLYQINISKYVAKLIKSGFKVPEGLFVRQGSFMRLWQRLVVNERKRGKYYLNKIWLKTQYIKKRRKVKDIAIECKCSTATILNYIHKFGLDKQRGKNGKKESKKI